MELEGSLGSALTSEGCPRSPASTSLTSCRSAAITVRPEADEGPLFAIEFEADRGHEERREVSRPEDRSVAAEADVRTVWGIEGLGVT